MTHLDARQDKATMKWHYTVRDGRNIVAVGRCSEDGGHDTAKEACACYRNWLIELRAEETGQSVEDLAETFPEVGSSIEF